MSELFGALHARYLLTSTVGFPPKHFEKKPTHFVPGRACRYCWTEMNLLGTS
jgi:hypothetical protein